MSFILDALKKSESDRQRQSGPALFEVKVAAPRTRLPLWAIAIALLLAVNLGIVVRMMLRHADGGGAPATVAGNVTGTTPPVAPPPVLPASAPASPPPAFAANAPAAAPQTAPAAVAAPPSGATPPAATNPGPGAGPAAGGTAPGAATTGVGAAGAAGAAAAAAGAAAASGTAANPEDYAPAEEPAPTGTGLGGHVRRGTAAGVPLYQEAAATAQIPQLRLDLHVFAAAPQDRFVMINMHKLHEGDSLPEGVHVESITPEGAVLSYNGSKFLLPRD